MLSDGVREYPETNLGFSVGTWIVLNTTYGDGDDMKRYSARIGSRVSCDFSPFSKLRFTIASNFSQDPDGLSCVGDVYIYNTNKSIIRTYSGALWADYGSSLSYTSDVDISSINQQAFFAVRLRTTVKSNRGTGIIKSIEFIN